MSQSKILAVVEANEEEKALPTIELPLQSAEITVKVALFGGPKIGKSSLFNRMSDDVYIDQADDYIGPDFKFAYREFQGHQVRISVWDTVSFGPYRSVSPGYYRQLDLALLCFDLTDERAMEKLQNHYEMVVRQMEEHTVLYLIGLKMDKKNKVKEEEIRHFMKTRPKIKDYLPCSSKTQEGIDEIVDVIMLQCQHKIPKQQKQNEAQDLQALQDAVLLPVMKRAAQKGWCPLF